MADEFDPALEARLRVAFGSEVEGRRVSLEQDHVAARWHARRRRRLAASASVLAAVLVVAAVAVAIPNLVAEWQSAAQPSIPPAAPVATYHELTALLPADAHTGVVRGEHHGSPGGVGDVTLDLGAVGAGSPVAYALSCLSEHVTITFDTGDTTPDTMDLQCDDGLAHGSLDWEAGPALVSVSTPSDDSWRLVLATGTGPARSPEPFDELRLAAQRARTTGGVTIASGEGPDPEATGALLTTDLGAVGAVHDIQLVIDCIGGGIDVRVMAGDTKLAGYQTACQPSVDIQSIAVASPGPDARLVVVADHDVTWRLLAVGPMPGATAAP